MELPIRTAVITALLLAAGAASAQDWSQWRGPSRDGRLVGFKAPAAWPKALVKRWSVNVGEGHSSPVIAGKRAFVLVRQGEQEVTLCLDLATGKTLWQDRVDAPFDSVIFPARRLGKAPRSTPLVHGGKLYTLGVNGTMTCFAAETGKVLWRRDFSGAFKTPMPICGASLSPLVDGKRIYVHAGHDSQGAFFALDKDTGQELWSWKGEGPGYTSPILATLGGARQLVTASHNMWIGLDPEKGTLLWSLPVRQNFFNHNSITPVVAGDLLICGANQRPTLALRVKRAGDRWVAEKAWETRDVTMSTSSPLFSGGRLYGVNEKRRGQLVMMEPETGRVLWSCPGDKGEQVTLLDAGSHLLVFTMNGDLLVYAKGDAGLAEVTRYAVADSATWAGPAVSGNRLLVKGAQSLALWEVPTSKEGL